MTFNSKIDVSKIDTDYPKLKEKNSVQGFRDNFKAIVDVFEATKHELTGLYNKKVEVSGDVIGLSHAMGDGPGTYKLALSLSESGVNPGSYEAARVTVDSKGRITAISDGDSTYVNQSGDTMTGDLIMDNANIVISKGHTVGGRNLEDDGKIIDAINQKNGFLVRQKNGVFTSRQFEAIDGLRILNPDGIQGPVTVGMSSFSIFFKGDVKGSIRVKSFEDMTINLKLDNTDIMPASGGKMNGSLDLNGNYLKGVKVPIYGTQVGDRDYNDARYLRGTLGDATGFVVQRRPGMETAPRELKGIDGIVIRNGDGFVGNPEIGIVDWEISLVGDVEGSAVVEGASKTVIKTQMKPSHTEFSSAYHSEYLWEMDKFKSLSVDLSNEATINASGYKAGQTYTLFISHHDRQVLFGEMFKFRDGFEHQRYQNMTTVMVFACDGKYLYGLHESIFA